MKDLGAKLKKIREEKQISLEDLQQQTKIRKAYLFAIEEGNMAMLPGEAYVKGFLKSYAQAVGINPQDIVTDYQKIRENDLEQKQQEMDELFMDRESRFSPVIIHILIILAIAAIILFSVFNILRLNRDDAAVDLPPAGEEVEQIENQNGEKEVQLEETAPGDPPEQAMGLDSFFLPYLQNDFYLELGEVEAKHPDQIEIDPIASEEAGSVLLQILVIERSWIRVQANGEDLFQGFLEPDDKRTFQGQEQIVIRVGNAGGILLQDVAGEYTIPLGRRGEVKDLVFSASGDD